jgi:protein-disulfide isomerase/uncharacterized membrane protein
VTFEKSHETGAQAPSRRLGLVAAFLCLVGIAVSVELTRIHVFVHTDPSYHSVCAMSDGVNCETVASSPYSVFARLPVSVWGIVGYVVMGLLVVWGLGRRRLHSYWPLGLLLPLTAFAAGVSVVLAFVSATRIDSICLFCTGSYVINAGLLVLCAIAVWRSGVPPLDLLSRDIRSLVSRPFLVVVLVLTGVIAIAVLRAYVPAYWKTPGWTDLPKLASGTDEDGSQWIGATAPSLTIVEFSDYECPHCRAAHKSTRLFAAKHPEQVRLVHRHLPLDMACHPRLRRPFHARACRFAEAAECAGLQGRFWEMNDALFSVQETTKTENVDPIDLAVRLGLDRAEFKTCLDEHRTAERVAGDVAAAIDLRLTGTPTFLINDRVFLGRMPEAQLERLLPRAGER